MVKVYCEDCNNLLPSCFGSANCHHESNFTYDETAISKTWKGQFIDKPKNLNRNNNCKNFELKINKFIKFISNILKPIYFIFIYIMHPRDK